MLLQSYLSDYPVLITRPWLSSLPHSSLVDLPWLLPQFHRRCHEFVAEVKGRSMLGSVHASLQLIRATGMKSSLHAHNTGSSVSDGSPDRWRRVQHVPAVSSSMPWVVLRDTYAVAVKFGACPHMTCFVRHRK